MPSPETLFESRWLILHRIGRWEYVRRPHSEICVGILAITPDDEIVLVEQFREPVQCPVIEIPAGIVGDEDEHRGEPLEETARRELLEETGYHAATIEPLAVSPTSSGLTSEFMHLFRAYNLTRRHDGGGVAGENIIVHHIRIEELDDWLTRQQKAGKAIDFKIHAALRMIGR